MDVRTLLALAQNAADVGNVRAASEFYEVALTRSPNNIDVLEAYAELMIHQAVDIPRAKQMLRHAIEVDPQRGYVKYLNLAQLSEKDEALQCYIRAAEIVNAELAAHRGKKHKRRHAGLRETLATVHCAIAELYLTDLCFSPDAEAQCEASLAAAIAANAECVEAHQLMGSLRISQCRQPDALPALRRAVELTHRLGEAHQPTYESKVELGRLLMQTAPDEAFRFLLEVLQLGDNNPYVWFLLGEAARMRGRYTDAARLLRRARVMLSLALGSDDNGNENENGNDNGNALSEVDAAISVLVAEMGGPAAAQEVADLDHPDPIALLEPEHNDEADENEEDDLEEPEWESCEDNDDDDENVD